MQRLLFAIVAIALAYNPATTLCCSSTQDLHGLRANLDISAPAYAAIYSHPQAASLNPTLPSDEFRKTDNAPDSHFIAPGGDDDLAWEWPLAPLSDSGQLLANPTQNPTAIAPGGDDDLPLSL